MRLRYLLLLLSFPFLLLYCNNPNKEGNRFKEMEFVLVDSLVFDEMQILRILDHSPKHGLYLMVNQGVEGRYFLIRENGEILAEKVLSEGPDAFGMVLHRAGFVGDEVMFISPIQKGQQTGIPVLWDKAGELILGLGDNRYLQYADQADIHDREKDYQCYYIFELRESN